MGKHKSIFDWEVIILFVLEYGQLFLLHTFVEYLRQVNSKGTLGLLNELFF